MVADVIDTTSALTTLGVPGLVLIVIILSGVIIYLFKLIQKLEDRVETLQEQRVLDAKEVNTKITEPLANLGNMQEQQGKIMQNIYDILQYSNRRGN